MSIGPKREPLFIRQSGHQRRQGVFSGIHARLAVGEFGLHAAGGIDDQRRAALGGRGDGLRKV